MKTVAIIQARMGSSRLAGKVLMDLVGETVLGRVVNRLGRCRKIDRMVVATTDMTEDDPIVQASERLSVACFRGAELDVLDRFYKAAHENAADAVVRVTSDCPLIDPEIVDDTVNAFRDQRVDYASNVFPRTYPRGLDAEVFSVAALDRAWSEAREPHQRAHVTPHFYENPEKFRQASLTGIEDYSRYRWTLDTREDLELLRTIYSRFDGRDNFSWQEVIQLMECEPELAELNSEVLQKSVREH